MRNKELFSLDKTIARELLESEEYPWQVLDEIKEFVLRVGRGLSSERFREAGRHVWIAKSASVAESAYIDGPTIIDENAEIRTGAYVRGGVIIGKGAVVGNSTEIKNSILFDGVQVPHYNYVGDSVLGYRAHLGAGAITSNLKSDRSEVTVANGHGKTATGRKKFGAAIGDGVEIGCNSVLCPGTVIGKNSTVYPLSRVRGFVAENVIYKGEGHIAAKEVRS